jgi:hypothetical protein
MSYSLCHRSPELGRESFRTFSVVDTCENILFPNFRFLFPTPILVTLLSLKGERTDFSKVPTHS